MDTRSAAATDVAISTEPIDGAVPVFGHPFTLRFNANPPDTPKASKAYVTARTIARKSLFYQKRTDIDERCATLTL
ncbi:hypothetical protein [Acetobacter nitrogenifigens]